MLRGALRRPCRSTATGSTRRRSRRTSTSSRAAGSTAARARDDGRGAAFRDARAKACGRAVRCRRGGRLQVAAHCGAQTTADTVELATHAAEAGADAVAVIGPPYFQLDERSLLEHFQVAAAACEPLPFYVYEFERASGYAVPISVLLELRAGAEPRRAQGLGRAVRQVRAVPRRGPRCLRRPGGAHLRRHLRGSGRGGASLAGRSPTGSPRSSASRPTPARSRSASCARP